MIPFFALLLLFAAAGRLGRTEGRGWFLALAAFSPLTLVYATEARAYALVATLALALFLLLFRGRPTPVRLVAAAAVATALLWIHYLAIFLVGAGALLLLARRRLLPLTALLSAALLFLPWIPVLAHQPKEATAWMREPFGASLIGFFSALGGTGRIPNPLGGPLPAWLAAIGAVIGAALLATVAWLARAGQDRESSDAVILTTLTMGLVAAASLVRPVAFSGRSEMVILPIWLWVVAKTAARNRLIRWVAVCAAAVAIGSSAFLLLSPKAAPPSSRVLPFVGGLVRERDTIYVAGGLYLPFRLAADRGSLKARVQGVPDSLEEHPGWFNAVPLSSQEVGRLSRALASDRSPHIFVLLPPMLTSSELLKAISTTPGRLISQNSDAVLFLLQPGARAK